MAKRPKGSAANPEAKVHPDPAPGHPPAMSPRIDEKIRALGDWRAETIAQVRRLIHEAVPEVEEDCKWVKPTNPLGVPTWSCGGIICTGEAYERVVKLTFARGASLEDPRGLFNASLEGNARRAIDIRKGESLDAEAFKRLIQAAAAQNRRSRHP